jgi:hypothetical protein
MLSFAIKKLMAERNIFEITTIKMGEREREEILGTAFLVVIAFV